MGEAVIVSHEHRFIFVRTRKTASTSTEIALSRLVGSDAVITSLSPRDEKLRSSLGGRPPQNHLSGRGRPGTGEPVPPGPGPGIRFYNHMPAEQIRAELGEEVWRRYFTFCFERNPWDKVVSLYYHRYRQDPRPGLERFLRSGEGAEALNWPLYTRSDAIAVDMIGRYENLDQDLAAALRQIGLPDPGPLPSAKAQFRPPGRNYRQELDQASRELISEIYATEISWHGYQW